jgi:UDP-N-acetylglucosamine--N-acetylmuramyl-(pentapeptide) pyrophosphoryl-undecaprenol N-acetylglucosamine transferase
MITFFTSPIGLGHATRDIAIAEELKTDIQFVSGEGASTLIARKGFKSLDVYKPDKFIVESGQLQHVFQWILRYYLYYKKCKAIAKKACTDNRPYRNPFYNWPSINNGEKDEQVNA